MLNTFENLEIDCLISIALLLLLFLLPYTHFFQLFNYNYIRCCCCPIYNFQSSPKSQEERERKLERTSRAQCRRVMRTSLKENSFTWAVWRVRHSRPNDDCDFNQKWSWSCGHISLGSTEKNEKLISRTWWFLSLRQRSFGIYHKVETHFRTNHHHSVLSITHLKCERVVIGRQRLDRIRAIILHSF